MAVEDGVGFKRVRTLTDIPVTKNYIRVKQADDLTVKNYTNVKESTLEKKDYINVVVVTYDQPKDYMLVNFIDAENLYTNPELTGAGDIIDGVGTLPDSHTFSNNSSTISAYVIGEDPAYDVNPEANSGRLAFRQTRSTNDDLIIGNRYLFSAEVWIDGYVDGVNSAEELRGININNNASLDIDRSRADVSGANQVWERVEVVFDITAESALIYLAHGLGVINTSTLNVQTRNLSLIDLGRSTNDDFDHNDFLFGDFA